MENGCRRRDVFSQPPPVPCDFQAFPATKLLSGPPPGYNPARPARGPADEVKGGRAGRGNVQPGLSAHPAPRRGGPSGCRGRSPRRGEHLQADVHQAHPRRRPDRPQGRQAPRPLPARRQDRPCPLTEDGSRLRLEGRKWWVEYRDAWVAEAADDAERKRREDSEVLRCEVPGPDGPLFADFHALRHTYLTLLGKGGVDLRTAQELAGHSTPVLTARYSHRRLHDLAGAVEKLPAFLPPAGPAPGAGTEAAALGATGTDGPLAGQLAGGLAGAGAGRGRLLSLTVGTEGAGAGAEEAANPLAGRASEASSRVVSPADASGREGPVRASRRLPPPPLPPLSDCLARGRA